MFKCINGWTKAKMLKVIKARKYAKAAYNEDYEHCEYRTRDGNKCAVGLFIPSKHEGFSFRGVASELLDYYPELKNFMPLKTQELEALQAEHDDEYNRANAKQAMINWVKKNVE